MASESEKQLTTFNRWLQEHRGLLFKIIRTYANDPAEADDLFQEISIQIWHSVTRFKGDAKVSTWIYRVALFAAISWTRKERRHDQKRADVPDLENHIISPAGQDDTRLKQLYRQLRSLNAVDRSVVLLTLEGYAYKDIADILGITTTLVGVKLNRSKQKLAAMQEGRDGS